MTNTLEFKQNSHLNPALSEPAARALNAGKLIGRWLNTDPETEGLAEIVIQLDCDHLVVGAVGVGGDGPIEWPRTNAKPLANLEEDAGQRAVSIAVTFDFGFMTPGTNIHLNK